jgi:uncharacterized Zn-binding protein involved in type VI secretion
MPGVVRAFLDSHIGHASVTPNPFHKTPYVEGSDDVFVNGMPVVRLNDKTGCGDPAVGVSLNVFVNGRGVHRQGDATGGHASWLPNAAATGSMNVFVNG